MGVFDAAVELVFRCGYDAAASFTADIACKSLHNGKQVAEEEVEDALSTFEEVQVQRKLVEGGEE